MIYHIIWPFIFMEYVSETLTLHKGQKEAHWLNPYIIYTVPGAGLSSKKFFPLFSQLYSAESDPS